MGLSYHFAFKAAPNKTAGELEAFLRSVEAEAKRMGFEPTLVLNAVFDTTERKQLARRLTTGLPVEDVRLRGANVPDDSRVWHLDTASGACRVPPSNGVLLILTNEQDREVIFGFFQYPDTVRDVGGKIVAETRLGGAWSFRDFVGSPDPRYRAVVKRFAEVGYLEAEKDEFSGG